MQLTLKIFKIKQIVHSYLESWKIEKVIISGNGKKLSYSAQSGNSSKEKMVYIVQQFLSLKFYYHWPHPNRDNGFPIF